MTVKEDVWFIQKLKFLNQKDKDRYYQNIEEFPMTMIIFIFLINLDNMCGYYLRRVFSRNI